MDEIQCRKLLLDFYSSELQAHSRLIIGFAVILLALFEVRLELKSILPIQSSIIYLAVFVAALAFWFSLMRLLAYGVLANATQHAELEGEGNHLVDVKNAVTKYALKVKILRFVPSCLFISAGQKNEGIQRLFGIGLCAFFSVVITVSALIVTG